MCRGDEPREPPPALVHGELGEKAVDDLTRVDFFTSHEGLNLLYESAQTRTVPRREGHYDLTTHLRIGERTRASTALHVEFFRASATRSA